MSKKVKVFITFGTRPEAIKLAPIIKYMEKNPGKFDIKICSAGQHKQMLKQVTDFFSIKTDYNLNLMTNNQSLGLFSSKLLAKIDKLLVESNPDIVLVQGDTATAFLTALASFYKKIKVGHVEAGLRTYNKNNPFPEEINRQLITRVADLHFAPTKKALDNLINEGVDRGSIFLTGNTTVDALELAKVLIEKNKKSIELTKIFKSLDYDKKIVLVTMHRRESFGEEIRNICIALKTIAKKYSKIQIVYPVHLNPNVKDPVFELLSNTHNIVLTEPLDYQSMLLLMSRSFIIITDSGGIQEEAPSFGKPVLVIRKETERTESIEAGISKLVGTDPEDLIMSFSEILEKPGLYEKMIPVVNPYGDGNAADKISEAIYDFFNS